MFFSVYSLGCKLNQLENEAIADSFGREGFTSVPWGVTDAPAITGSPSSGLCGAECGIFVINTCTVTSMAEQKARRVIRKTLRDFPDACLIVTGCYAQMEKAGLEALEAGLSDDDEPQRIPGRLFVILGSWDTLTKNLFLDLVPFV